MARVYGEGWDSNICSGKWASLGQPTLLRDSDTLPGRMPRAPGPVLEVGTHRGLGRTGGRRNSPVGRARPEPTGSTGRFSETPLRRRH